MDACNRERLPFGMKSPDEIQRSIPQWIYLSKQLSRAQLCRPDAVIELPPEGRASPEYMNPRDGDIHLIELKFCSDTKPEQTLISAQNQHKNSIEN
eukprot:1142564-Pelagomonas_calceolata.AAC.6